MDTRGEFFNLGRKFLGLCIEKAIRDNANKLSIERDNRRGDYRIIESVDGRSVELSVKRFGHILVDYLNYRANERIDSFDYRFENKVYNIKVDLCESPYRGGKQADIHIKDKSHPFYGL